MKGHYAPSVLWKSLRGAIQRNDGSVGVPLEGVKVLAAKALIEARKGCGTLGNLKEAEFHVFSQFGDDGIIQYLLQHVPIESESFVEFGVENYVESNTRFLLVNDNWSRLVLDANHEHIEYIRSDPIYWRHELVAKRAFIDESNINDLLTDAGMVGPLGILSIDIDGNDYWVWKAISVVQPAIVIVEYNAVFGKNHAITVPYNPQFQRTQAHSSNLFWGTSIKALCLLAERKGFAFVGCNSAGNNAYFVKNDCVGALKVHTVGSGYVESKFRESRDKDGRLSFLSGAARLNEIREMVVYDVECDRQVQIKDLQPD